jgi:hypothetical protein
MVCQEGDKIKANMSLGGGLFIGILNDVHGLL